MNSDILAKLPKSFQMLVSFAEKAKADGPAPAKEPSHEGDLTRGSKV